MARSVTELRRLAERDSAKTVRVFNPTSTDFKCEFKGKEYMVRSMEMERFKFDVGRHIQKHLLNHTINIKKIDTLDKKKMKDIKEQISA